MNKTHMFSLVFAGCMPRVQPDSISDVTYRNPTWNDSGSPESSQTAVYVSTIADDYSIGALVSIDIDTLSVDEDIATTTGDTVVVTTGEKVVVLNRLNTDTVRIYDPGEWTHPTLEFALPDLSNPQDAVICDDQIWVTQHNRDRVTGHSLTTGIVVDSVDLSPWTGSDGFAEATGMLVEEDTLRIVVQEFNQNDNWTSEGGAILSVPCSGGTPIVFDEVGPSPVIVTSNQPGIWGVRTGLYGELDGAIYLADEGGIRMPPVLTEENIQTDITAAAMTSDHLMFITADDDWNYTVQCLNLTTGETQIALASSNFLSDLAIDDTGRAWVAARTGWAEGTPEPGGLHVFDPEECQSALSTASPIRTTLSPFNIAFL